MTQASNWPGEWVQPGVWVWVDGWPKSKAAKYVVTAVRSDGTVDVWQEHRGRGRLRTVDATRLGRRRQPVTPPG